MGNAYEDRLGTQPILPLVFKMALPSVAAQFVNLLYSMVDRVYIGHIPVTGTAALAGVGVTSAIILLISAFASIVSGGGAPLAAISLGKGDRERAGKILGNGFVMLLFFTVLTQSLGTVFMEPLLRLTGASDNTIGYASSYMSIYLCGTVFVLLATGLNTFINCQGRPGIAMASVLIGAVLNIVLDPVFIFVFGMGVSGAALATVISQGCSAIWVLCFLLSSNASLRLQRENMKPDFKIIGSILSLGISPFVMAATESLIGFVLNGSLAVYGDIYVSALTIMQSGMQVVSVPLTGFGQGVTPIISYNYGHGLPDRVRKTVRVVMATMFGFNFTATLLMISFPQVLSGLFTTDAELIAVICKVLPTFMFGMSIFGLQRACQNSFLALGEAKVSLFIALLRKVFLLVPLALLLPRFFGVMGVFAAEGVADTTAAILCTTIFVLRFPKLMRVIEQPKTKQTAAPTK